MTTEIIPMSPAYISGMIHYRGTKVPIIDLGILFNGSPCQPQLSTRIILISITTKQNETEIVGLLAENVTETKKMPPQWKPVLNDEYAFQISDPVSGKRFLKLFELDQYLPDTISETITLCKTLHQ